MPSIIQNKLNDRIALLATLRRVYLRMIAIELGMPNSELRDIALREAQAMIEMAVELLPREAPESDNK